MDTRSSDQSRQRLQRLAQLGEQTAGIIHELKNPVSFLGAGLLSIKKELEDLETGERSSDTSEEKYQSLKTLVDGSLDDMQLGVDRLYDIIKGVGTLSNGRDMDRTHQDLHSCIETSLTILKHRLNTAVTVEKDYSTEHAKVHCNAAELSQVFVNLFNNAIDAMEGAGILRLESRESKGGVQIIVRDTGNGMSKETLEHIFEPFYTTKSTDKGSGLGLGISKEIVEAHNGAIHVTSELGKGTSITLWFPYSK